MASEIRPFLSSKRNGSSALRSDLTRDEMRSGCRAGLVPLRRRRRVSPHWRQRCVCAGTAGEAHRRRRGSHLQRARSCLGGHAVRSRVASRGSRVRGCCTVGRALRPADGTARTDRASMPRSAVRSRVNLRTRVRPSGGHEPRPGCRPFHGWLWPCAAPTR